MTHSVHVTIHAGRNTYRAACECGWRAHQAHATPHPARQDANRHERTPE